ncbi:hypothetical protein FHT85_005173 [Rhizobium sp. BK312]|nr:hypothetical protein [Rhizobium sp. BK312]
MIMFYQISPIDKWAIAQCSNAYNAWLRKFSAQKTLLLQIERRLFFSVRTEFGERMTRDPTVRNVMSRFVSVRQSTGQSQSCIFVMPKAVHMRRATENP